MTGFLHNSTLKQDSEVVEESPVFTVLRRYFAEQQERCTEIARQRALVPATESYTEAPQP